HRVIDSTIGNRAPFKRQRFRNRGPRRLADLTSKRLHRQEPASHYPDEGPECDRAAQHGSFRALIQIGLRGATPCLCRQAAPGKGLLSDDNKLHAAQRDSAQRRIRRSGTPEQAVQASSWSKSIALATRT